MYLITVKNIPAGWHGWLAWLVLCSLLPNGRASSCHFVRPIRLSVLHNFVRSITQKVKEISTPNFIGRGILMTRSAVYKNHNSPLHGLGVMAFCYFHTCILSRAEPLVISFLCKGDKSYKCACLVLCREFFSLILGRWIFQCR